MGTWGRRLVEYDLVTLQRQGRSVTPQEDSATMTQPQSEQPVSPSESTPAHPQTENPQAVAPEQFAPPAPYGTAGQYPAQPPAPQMQFAQPVQQPQYPAQYQTPQQYQGQPPVAPQPYQGQPYQGQYGQMSQQPMPNPAYGYPQPKSKIVAGLLGIFLGGLGIHRFYLGYTTIGIIQIALTVLLGVFTFGLVGLWGVVEGIMIFAGASYFQRDAKGIPLRD